MGTNHKNSPSSDRTFYNGSPSNKKYSNGTQQQRPSPTKSINIKTPNKNQSSINVAGQTNNKQRLGGSCSPPNFSFFAASKCYESPSPQSLPKPPTSWFEEGVMKAGSYKASVKSQRARKSLNLSGGDNASSSCAAEFAKQQKSFASFNSNDHYTQNLKLLLNVNA